MKITFALKEFFKDRASKSPLGNHFLLSQATVEVTLVFEDSTEKVFSPPKGPNGRFVLDIKPADIPDSVTATTAPLKKTISTLTLDFSVPFRYAARTFQLLRIIQDFSLTALPTNSDQNIDYALSPFSWKHSAFSIANRRTAPNRTANARVHPLLDLTGLSKNLVLINALVLDLTELWQLLHEKSVIYRIYGALTAADKVTFKVFAHTGGSPFIWYSVVPSYLAESTTVSPHVFFSPFDHGEKQNEKNEKKYLLDNREYFASMSGGILLLRYLLPPVDDDAIPNLNAHAQRGSWLRFDMPVESTRFELAHAPISGRELLKEAQQRAELIEWVIAMRRNVVNFASIEKPSRKIVPLHWSIPAGFEKAFYALDDIKPQQFLLMPQMHKRNGKESGPHLKIVTDTIVDLLQTNTELIGSADDDVVAKDKMIVSCYSESGFDLWNASMTNKDHLKAIIGIEPNSVNPKGAAVIPELLKKKVRVFIIGRHQRANDFFRPKIAKNLQDQIRFLPDEPRKIMEYPPDPDHWNDVKFNFVKYRVGRMTNVDLDPLMLEREKKILDDLATRPKPITGKAAIPQILQPLSDSDDLRSNRLTSIMYSHNFALTGGQEMTLADPDDFYNKPVSYRTFFQQAVEEIEKIP